jgi:hypothetical protein
VHSLAGKFRKLRNLTSRSAALPARRAIDAGQTALNFIRVHELSVKFEKFSDLLLSL